MNQEIERKFLVTNDNFKTLSYDRKYLKQGFLNTDKERVVRVRVTDDKAFLTVKGISSNEGTSRFEWEKEIDKSEGEQLMLLCEPGIIEKYRYYHRIGEQVFEIDEFLGDNDGLIIAEIELNHVDEFFEKPNYIGEEVTGQEKYYNSNLSKFPFNIWA